MLEFFGKKAPAVGFMVIVDDILEALDHQKIPVTVEESAVTITYTTETFAKALADATALREAGKAVILTKE